MGQIMSLWARYHVRSEGISSSFGGISIGIGIGISIGSKVSLNDATGNWVSMRIAISVQGSTGESQPASASALGLAWFRGVMTVARLVE